MGLRKIRKGKGRWGTQDIQQWDSNYGGLIQCVLRMLRLGSGSALVVVRPAQARHRTRYEDKAAAAHARRLILLQDCTQASPKVRKFEATWSPYFKRSHMMPSASLWAENMMPQGPDF